MAPDEQDTLLVWRQRHLSSRGTQREQQPTPDQLRIKVANILIDR